MTVLLKALVEGLSGQPVGVAPASAARTDGTAQPFSTAEFDELCAAFGMPNNIELLMQQQQAVPHG